MIRSWWWWWLWRGLSCPVSMTSIARVGFGRVGWFAGAVPSGRDVKTLGEGGVWCWRCVAASYIRGRKRVIVYGGWSGLGCVWWYVRAGEKKQPRVGQHKVRNNNATTASQQQRAVDDDTTKAGLAAGYFGTCGTWPGGCSRTGCDDGPAQRSQIHAIGTAIEHTTRGSSLLRKPVGKQQSIERACSLLGRPSPHSHSSRSRTHTRMRLKYASSSPAGRSCYTGRCQKSPI